MGKGKRHGVGIARAKRRKGKGEKEFKQLGTVNGSKLVSNLYTSSRK